MLVFKRHLTTNETEKKLFCFIRLAENDTFTFLQLSLLSLTAIEMALSFINAILWASAVRSLQFCFVEQKKEKR